MTDRDLQKLATRVSAAVVTVASVPAGHPYVARVTSDPGVRLLPDPPVVGAAEGVWWPPAVLDPEWITRHRDDVDVLHVHFGTESFSPAHLAACLDTAHAVGWPVVFTAHDLEHPQLRGAGAYDRQLDILMRSADALLTLTPSAAAEIAGRWHRTATVLAHPAVLAADAALPPVRVDARRRIGVHLKDLRPNVDGVAAVRALTDALERLGDAGIPAAGEVRLHRQVRDRAARDEVRRLCSERPELPLTLLEHDRLSDAELIVALSGLDACVLPYRHGTHSGWLELCWDLGVPVAAPAVGHYADQHADGSVTTFALDEPASLAAAVTALWDRSPRPGTVARADVVAARRRQRRDADAAVARAHADLYRQLLRERGA